MNKVDIYCRLSDEDRGKTGVEESESIQNQKTMLINYCIERGWDIHKIYADEDYSGADQTRPDFNRMIKDCEERRVNIVLCKSQSRFSREVEVVEKYLHNKFLEWGIRFIGVVDNADTANAGNKKARQINGLVNEWYLEDLSENIRKTLRTKRVNGEWTGSFAPYGYVPDPYDKNHLVIDPVAAAVVHDIFEMYRDGKGYVSIAKNLNERGILNPYLYKKACGSNFKTAAKRCTSKKWTDSTISQMLRREVYTGTLVQGKQTNISYKNNKRVKIPEDEWIRTPNAHEPIVEPDLWAAVQRRIGCNSRQEKYSGERHVLSGKVYCAICGNIMWKMSYALSGGRYKYLKCKTVKTAPDACHNSHSIRLDALIDVVLSQINAMLSEYYDPSLIDTDIEPARSSQFDDRMRVLRGEKADLARAIEKQEGNVQKLYEDKLEGIVSDRQFISISRKFDDDLENHRKRLEMIEEELSRLTGDPAGPAVDRDAMLTKYRHMELLTRDVVDEFIDAVYIGPLMKAEGRRSVEIKWRV